MTTQIQLSDVDAGAWPLQSSLFALIKYGLDKNPHSPVTIVTHQPHDHLQALRPADGKKDLPIDNCLIWTYDDLHNASLKLIAGLAKHGVKAGATIATFIPNGIEPSLFNWTSMIGKYTYAPLDPGASNPVRSVEARTVLEMIEPDVVVVQDATAAAGLDLLLASLTGKPTLKIVLDASVTPPSGWANLLDIGSDTINEEAKQDIEREALVDDLERIAVILFTSGTTTGKPKGCPLTVKNRIHFAHMDLQTDQDAEQEWRYAYITQNYRAIAVAISLIGWSKGHCLVLPGPGFSPPMILDAIEKHHINWFPLVPFALHAMITHPRFQSTDISSIRSIGIGADIIHRDLYRKASKAFPDANVWVIYGMTEGGCVFDWPIPGKTTEEDIPWHADIAPIGTIRSGTRLKIADDNNKPVPRNAVGDIHVSSNAFLRRYAQDVKPEDFYVDGSTYWFKTGDTGLMNDGGWVYILGRTKDIIKRAGVPVTPGALESALDAFLKSQTSVVGIPHETLGDEPYAVVRSLNGHTKEQVMKHVVDMFGYDYALGGVATLQDLGLTDFPINPSEKIMKIDLQRAIAQYV